MQFASRWLVSLGACRVPEQSLSKSYYIEHTVDNSANHLKTQELKMVKIYKPGKVAIVLQGRQAGRKVVVIKQLDEGTKERPYPHAIVAGVERYPRKVTRRMGAKKLERRNKVKPFIKAVNYSHLFPTRYNLELEGLKGVVSAETFKEPSHREDAKKKVKTLLEERYIGGKNKWFFQPLRF